MALEKITQVTGTGVYIPGEDVDTDRIIPARFMKCVTFDGLGEYAFYDERIDPGTGEKKKHPLNEERFAGAKFLLAGSNFGCGSSREHAPQALYRYGFKAILAESFAEIFFGNSTTLGIPCAVMSKEDIAALAGLIEADPAQMITLDLLENKVSAADMDFAAQIPSRDLLVQGKWDAIADLLEGADQIKATASKLAYFTA